MNNFKTVTCPYCNKPSVYHALRKFFGHDVHVGQSDIATCKKIIESIEQNLLSL